MAAQAFQMLIANPVAAIAAGAALIATSKVVKNLLTQGPVTSVNDALITSNGDIIKFHPDDNILAMKDFSNLNTGGYQRVEVFGTLRGTDLFVSSSRGEKEYGR